MASGPFQLYNRTLGELANSTLDWDADDHMAILTADYDFDATHTTFADVASFELAAGGDYANQNLASETVFYNASGNVSFDANDVVFTSAGSVGPAGHIIILNAANTAAFGAEGFSSSSTLFGAMLLDSAGANVSSTSGQFQVQWNANGLFTLDQTL